MFSIIILCAAYILYPGYEEFDYSHLIRRSLNKTWTPRILDNGDRMPEKVYCLENHTIMKDILNDKDFIREMLTMIEKNKLAGISSFHLKKEYEMDTPMPAFIVLNNRFHYPNKFSIDFNEREYEFIFNPLKMGGSTSKQVQVKKKTSLCKGWNEIPNKPIPFKDFVVQVNADVPVFYRDRLRFENVDLIYSGELAYSLQDYWDEISNPDSICK